MANDPRPLAFLLGTWRGEGRGDYPTISAFTYGEEVTFTHPPSKPFLAYTQRTWALDDGRPLHGEMGYWRVPAGDDQVEVVIAHPTGVAEVGRGDVTTGPGGVSAATVAVIVQATALQMTPSAKLITELRRELRVDGDVLTYDLFMAAVGNPLTHHLRAELRRDPS